MRKISFCYGHRLHNHEGKCATLHGHNAVVEVHATPVGELNDQGMVIDFTVIKEKVGEWIDKYWDHNTIIFEEDTETLEYIRKCPGKKAPFVLPGNPTSENLASYLLRDVCPTALKDSGVIVHKIVFWETENCFAEESLDPKGEEAGRLYGLAN